MGRKKIPNAIRKNFLIPMSKEKEVIDFINAIQQEAIAKTESEKLTKTLNHENTSTSSC